MDPAIFVSSHLDDVVLSAGQAVASWPGATVVTVCTASPEEPMSTDYDRKSGFGNAREAMYRRRHEDHRALHLLGASHVHLGLLDDQYGGSDPDAIYAALSSVLIDVQPAVVVAPLGLVHPDHRKVAYACQLLAREGREDGITWWVYEDAPSRVLYPESVPEAMEVWRRFLSEDLGVMTLDFFGTSDLAIKERAVDCYASQLWALDRHAVLVPERIWRLER